MAWAGRVAARRRRREKAPNSGMQVSVRRVGPWVARPGNRLSSLRAWLGRAPQGIIRQVTRTEAGRIDRFSYPGLSVWSGGYSAGSQVHSSAGSPQPEQTPSSIGCPHWSHVISSSSFAIVLPPC